MLTERTERLSSPARQEFLPAWHKLLHWTRTQEENSQHNNFHDDTDSLWFRLSSGRCWENITLERKKSSSGLCLLLPVWAPVRDKTHKRHGAINSSYGVWGRVKRRWKFDLKTVVLISHSSSVIIAYKRLEISHAISKIIKSSIAATIPLNIVFFYLLVQLL